MEEYERLLDRLLREVGGARRGIASSYERLWRGKPEVRAEETDADGEEPRPGRSGKEET